MHTIVLQVKRGGKAFEEAQEVQGKSSGRGVIHWRRRPHEERGKPASEGGRYKRKGAWQKRAKTQVRSEIRDGADMRRRSPAPLRENGLCLKRAR